ncbi:heavy metal translocating P-type ATPase [Rubripirellula amarantea]|nr:heavy metal translocating P-type ATPase [Rubripirellula amarantea]
MNKEKIELRLLLPTVTHSDDACITRLSELLQSKAGVDAAHISASEAEQPDRICIHYDPRIVSIGEVRELAHRAGVELHQRYGHWLSQASPMHARRASAIESRLGRIPGVIEASVTAEGMVRAEYDRQLTNASTIESTLASWTKEVSLKGGSPSVKKDDGTCHAHAGHDHSHGGIFGPRSELIFAVLCGVFLVSGWLIATLETFDPWVAWMFYILAYGFGGYFTVTEAIEKIRAGKFEIDFLMIVAAAGAASLGAWAEGAFLLFLFSIGHAMEGYAMGRAKHAIESLSQLAPRIARVRRDGAESEIAVEDLVVGDVVIVKPDERLAADGFVVAGESSVDQSPITGESMPVEKQPVRDVHLASLNVEDLSSEYRVFAGTINQAGVLEIQVTKIASESTLSRIVTMVNEAETRVSPTQKFTKKFERYFVPIVVAGVLLLIFTPLVLEESFGESFYRAMAVLVAASPCALAIATPSAVLSGIARAARDGVLIKGGGPLEALGSLDAIAFDKTGTLTEGKPKVTDVHPADNVDEAELLRNAVAVEELSKHPLARAVVRDGRNRLATLNDTSASDHAESPIGIPHASDLKSITGRGLEAVVDGEVVHVGKDDLFSEVAGEPLSKAIRNIVETLERGGRTTMVVRRGNRYLGVIGLMDAPRRASTRTILRLREMGIRRMVMISGDNQQVADAVAKAIGIEEAFGDLMPEDKVAEVRKLQANGGVAMVGDGVNDAPAMASAAVGIAMGAAGSDVALETADIALMADKLENLPLAIGVSRQARRIIQQNLWMSLGMVVLLVPATILGLNIGPAVVLHEGSTLVVVFNALRLLAYKPNSPAAN